MLKTYKILDSQGRFLCYQAGADEKDAIETAAFYTLATPKQAVIVDSDQNETLGHDQE